MTAFDDEDRDTQPKVSPNGGQVQPAPQSEPKKDRAADIFANLGTGIILYGLLTVIALLILCLIIKLAQFLF